MLYDLILHLMKKLDWVFGIIEYSWMLLFSFHISKHYDFKGIAVKQ